MKYDILIIGSGAAGLMAAKYLSDKKYKCCILEAAAFAGGRMHTITNGFKNPVEAGAEFIHGKLPLTLKLLKKAGIKYEAIAGKMITVQKGQWLKDEEHDEHWEAFMKKLKQLKKDCTITAFLNKHFSDVKYERLRKAVQNFAEGFDLADPDKASMLALKEEWNHEGDKQFRIRGGYIQLVNYLIEDCKKQQTDIFLNSPVAKIEHSTNQVTVYTKDNKIFTAKKLISTISAGILQAGKIEFVPSLPLIKSNAEKIGFGAVIKFLLEFQSPFWKQHAEKIGFILSDEEIPTWWTQYPAESNLLTGWLGGPKAKRLSAASSEALLSKAIQSLAAIFHLGIDSLKNQLVQHEICCWANQSFIEGGYSYNTMDSEEAKLFFSQPINNSIFFAGEAFYDGDSQGTVEAALQSGKNTAKAIHLASKKQ